ncbi:helix-turn-helix transcriptional regulator [Virgibacillus sp. DJP39]|uniref:helix-turn-helix transcriptional regulator n=1 Tax=Virgibacillus sp. DJP39 TaxID=3409790 RepID=UPI003BB7E838
MTSNKLNSRDRLLTLIEIMQKHSDDEHMISLNEIIDHFPIESDINQATLRNDLVALSSSDLLRICIYQQQNGLENKYWYDGIGLKLHELRLLLDAVVAARFIPHKETIRLLDQLKRFTGHHITEEMDNQLYIADEPGIALKDVGDTVHVLHEAIHHSKIIEFQYGKFTTEKNFELNREGATYTMKPYGLVWSQDFYYLIVQEIEREEKRHFRVDRMRSLSMTDNRFVRETTFDMNAYLKKLFHMYSGEEISIEIEFDNHLINVVIDRFGPGADIRPMDNGRFKLFTKAIFADGLVRWLLTWGSDAKVLYPQKLVERMKSETEKFYHTYHH